MRYSASEKLEIIRLVEQSHLPARQTLLKLGVPAGTFYRWYDRMIQLGPDGLEDRRAGPTRVWNRIPDDVRDQIVQLALEQPELYRVNWQRHSRIRISILCQRLLFIVC